jgi:tRNA (uracil-5-)-methyltransferase
MLIFMYLYFSHYTKKVDFRAAGGEGGGTIEHVSGVPYIEEILLGMTFRISPEAFFQINSLGAEELYKTAIDLVKPTNDTALLDVCCGTGTIGLIFAKVS